ncbi:MAG: response regulator [Acidobacteria bacterium]|nr:response regulator [Acidobacteriota bacterium]
MHPGGAPEPRDPLAEETSRARSELPRRRRPWPLRWALVVPFTAVLVAVVGLILWLSLRNGREAVEDVASDLRSELILRIWQYLDDYLETPHRLNALNADALLEGQLDPGDPPALDRHFWRQLQHFETVSFVFYGSPAGGAAGAGRISDGTLVVDSTPLDADHGLIAGPRIEYAAVGAGDRGPVLKVTQGFDARHRPWFEAAVQAGRPVWCEVYPFFAEASLAVAASKPVYAPDGTLAGVVGADLTLARVSEFLSKLQVGRTGRTFIVERSGLLVASSGGEPLFVAQDGDEPRRVAARDSTTPLVATTARFLEGLPGGLGGVVGAEQLSFGGGGRRVFVHVAPLTDPRGIDWLIVVALPEADFLGKIEASTRTTLWLSLGALALAVGLGVIAARGVTRPIERLRDATGAIAEGRLDERVPEAGIHELAELARTFNRMAAQLRESFLVLESRVAQRTAQLRTAKEESDAASQAKTRFLANLSHEIRSPLGTILGYLDLLDDDATTPEERRRYLKTARRAGGHLNRLLGDLLDIGRIEAGRLELNRRPSELAEILDDLGASFEAQAEEQGLGLEIRAEGRLPWRFTIDPTRLRQVLSNLLSNALRYTEKGEVRLTVRAEPPLGESSATLVFAVRDTGVGIRPEDQGRLFRRFTQLDASRSPGAGFGLGLAITHQLVELMGGAIECASEPGQGSTFTVRLPVDGCASWGVDPSPGPRLTDSSLSLEMVPLEGRVLIADDSPELLELCGKMLERWGLEHVTAADGEEAVTVASAQPFDIVLMDWQMPRLDGLEATRELRRRGVGSAIVALTAAAGDGDRERCLAAGCSAYLVKPIDFKELYRLLQRLLAGARSPAAKTADVALDDELDQLRRAYLGRLPAELDALAAALAAGDWSALGARVHRLAGTAGSFGLGTVYAAAERLEQAGRRADGEEAEQHLAALRVAVEGAAEKCGTARGEMAPGERQGEDG